MNVDILTAKKADARAHVLLSAAGCVLSDRNADYGEPEDNFEFIAALTDAYLHYRRQARGDSPLQGWDVANLAMLTKIARSVRSPEKADHWIDIAGYAACGYRCVTERS